MYSIAYQEIAKTRTDIENKLNAKKINISKTTEEEVEVLTDFVKMTMNEVMVDPTTLGNPRLKQTCFHARHLKRR